MSKGHEDAVKSIKYMLGNKPPRCIGCEGCYEDWKHMIRIVDGIETSSPPPVKPSIKEGDAGPKVAEMLVDRIRELEKELEDLRTVAEDVYDLAHYHSTGPGVCDTLWVIREMLKDYI